MDDLFTSNRYRIWVVSWFNNGDLEATVTAFNNKKAAQKCYAHFLGVFDHVNYDECPVYGNFIISDENETEF